MAKMDNNTTNRLVRKCIFTSLMQLMEKKDFQQITVTEITGRAGVSRMAYYRNYTSKEDIPGKSQQGASDRYPAQLF